MFPGEEESQVAKDREYRQADVEYQLRQGSG